MLHHVLGFALIGMGALTMVARVVARATEQQRRPAHRSFPLSTGSIRADSAASTFSP